jgi:hypothetical protein
MAASHNFSVYGSHGLAKLHMSGCILRENGLDPLHCIILDRSQFGATINALDVAPPDNFALSLNALASLTRNCKVIWREGFVVGVRFVA